MKKRFLVSAIIKNDADGMDKYMSYWDPDMVVNGVPILVFAAGFGNYEAVLKFGKKAELLNRGDSRGVTPLMAAAASGRDAIVSALLSLGASPHSRDMDGRTPLHHASAAGDENCVTELSLWSDINAQDKEGMSPLMVAAMCGNASVTRFLAKRSKLELRDFLDGKTALGWSLEGMNRNFGVFESIFFSGAKLEGSCGDVDFFEEAKNRLSDESLAKLQGLISSFENAKMNEECKKSRQGNIGPSI